MCAHTYSVVAEEDDDNYNFGEHNAGEIGCMVESAIGLQLRVPAKTIEEICTVAGREPVVNKFQKMLQHWLDNGKEERRTWGFLAEAVRKAGNVVLAAGIRRRENYKQDVKGMFMRYNTKRDTLDVLQFSLV